jgi:hypothetical protein
LISGFAVNASAKMEKREQPKARFVEETLEAVGGEHNPEKMDVKRISSIAVGDTYYHVFEGELDDVGYHIIIFDNYGNYLGFYKLNYAPINYQRDKCIVIDSGDVDEDGDPLYFYIPIDEKKGLPERVQVGGVPTKLVKAPKKEGAEEAKPVDDGSVEPEFREWTITHQGRALTVRAIYVKQTFAEVFLKAEASGKTKGFQKTALSKEDREYITQFD